MNDRLRLGAFYHVGASYIPTPVSLTSAIEDGRYSGHGGGGQSCSGGVTPHFCTRCGKTVSRKKVKPSCDVCSQCRSRGR